MLLLEASWSNHTLIYIIIVIMYVWLFLEEILFKIYLKAAVDF
jgi:hypothetical protein